MTVEQQHFPVLINGVTTNHSNKTEDTPSFAKMAALPKIVESTTEVVKPGHVNIQYDKDRLKIISTYGQKTPQFVLYETQEDSKDSLHFRMNQAVEHINAKQQKRIAYYNEVHGEGAYEEMFCRDLYSSDDDNDQDIMSDDYESD